MLKLSQKHSRVYFYELWQLFCRKNTFAAFCSINPGKWKVNYSILYVNIHTCASVTMEGGILTLMTSGRLAGCEAVASALARAKAASRSLLLRPTSLWPLLPPPFLLLFSHTCLVNETCGDSGGGWTFHNLFNINIYILSWLSQAHTHTHITSFSILTSCILMAKIFLSSWLKRLLVAPIRSTFCNTKQGVSLGLYMHDLTCSLT